MDIGQAMNALDEVVQDERFMSFQKEFLGNHCHKFEETDENALEWTELHMEYEQAIEGHLEAELAEKVPGFSMAQLQEELPAYIEAQRDAEEGHAATLDLLVSFGDYEAFKALMLEAKRETMAGETEVLAPSFPPSVESALDQAKEMAYVAADPAAGWVKILNKGWMQVDRLMRPGQNDVVRMTMDIEIPPEASLDMMINYTEERKAWDSYSTITIVEDNGPNDKVMDWSFKIPLTPTIVYRIRNVIVPDFPEPGCVTGVYVAPSDDPNAKKPEGLGNYIIIPTETGCRMTSLEEVPTSIIPNFMMNWMISTFTPRFMVSMIDKYKKVKGPF